MGKSAGKESANTGSKKQNICYLSNQNQLKEKVHSDTMQRPSYLEKRRFSSIIPDIFSSELRRARLPGFNLSSVISKLGDCDEVR